MRKRLFACLSVFLLVAVGRTGFVYGQANISMDEAIQAGVSEIEAKLARGTKVVVLNFESSSKPLSNYVLTVMARKLKENGKVTVADQAALEPVLQGMKLQQSDPISDGDAKTITEKLSYQSIVSGSLEDRGTYYRVRFKTIDAKSLASQATSSLNVDKGSQTTAIISGAKTANPTNNTVVRPTSESPKSTETISDAPKTTPTTTTPSTTNTNNTSTTSVAKNSSFSWEWQTFSDKDSNGGSSNITEQIGTVADTTTHRYFGNITNKYEYGFAGFQIVPTDNVSRQALRTATSFSFKVKGDGQKYAVKMPTGDISDFCYYETTFTAPKGSEKVITVQVKSLKQPSWGKSKRFNQAIVDMVEFQTTHNGKPGTFDLTIWDFEVHQ